MFRFFSGCIDVAYSSSLTASDANSVHPLTHNGGPALALALAPSPAVNTTTLCPPPSTDSPGTVAASTALQNTSIFTYEDDDDDDPYFPGIRRFHPPTVEPTAPPLFHDPDAEPRACYQDTPEQNCDDYYRGTRYRDQGGRLRPLYRTSRNNFSSSGGRCGGVLGPLVHRANGGGHSHGLRRSGKHDRCAIYRTPGSYPMREDSVSPPPPSYEQSCNENS